MQHTGIYSIRNLVNGKLYIGSASTSFSRRFREHRNSLNSGTHCNRYLQAAWNKYGASNFEFQIQEPCEPNQCILREQYWIDRTRCTNRNLGYNLSPTAGSNLGHRWTDESKTKLRTTLATIRSSLSKAHTGVLHTEATKNKISNAQKGKYNGTPKTRKMLSKTMKGNKHCVGRRHSSETIKRMSDARKAYWERVKAGISKSFKGVKRSPETIKKLSDAAKAQWARRKANQN